MNAMLRRYKTFRINSDIRHPVVLIHDCLISPNQIVINVYKNRKNVRIAYKMSANTKRVLKYFILYESIIKMLRNKNSGFQGKALMQKISQAFLI